MKFARGRNACTRVKTSPIFFSNNLKRASRSLSGASASLRVWIAAYDEGVSYFASEK